MKVNYLVNIWFIYGEFAKDEFEKVITSTQKENHYRKSANTIYAAYMLWICVTHVCF